MRQELIETEHKFQENEGYDAYIQEAKDCRTLFSIYEDAEGRVKVMTHGFDWKIKALLREAFNAMEEEEDW